MEIRCEQCGHAGEAGGVEPADGGVRVLCAKCGHGHVVSAGGDASEAKKSGGDAAFAEQKPGPTDGAADVDRMVARAVQFVGGAADSMGSRDDAEGEGPTFEVGEEFVDESLRELIPQPGDGPRCPKCFALWDEPVNHCPKCGLSAAAIEKYSPGEAPWEKPPEGLQWAHQEAIELWEEVAGDSWTEISEFVDYVVEHELLDYGIRTLQRHMVEHPDDDQAKRGLMRLAKRLRVDVEIARDQAEAQADEFTGEVRRFRTAFLVGALIFWVVLFVVFTWLFWM